MATFPARWQSICNALIDGVATVQQMSALADAHIANLPDEEITAAFPEANPPVTRATLTDAQRAAIAVTANVQFNRNTWRANNVRVKQEAARQAALSDSTPL
jgi:microcompartment protein CcmL/EutN